VRGQALRAEEKLTAETCVRIITLTESDHGRTVSVCRGDVVEVSLPENPTTGFRWAVEGLEGAGVSLLSAALLPSPANAGLGHGGVRVFRFATGNAGNVQLRLKRWREWEGADSITARFDVTLNVRD
jgi:inhibitor of cysteine peptidase